MTKDVIIEDLRCAMSHGETVDDTMDYVAEIILEQYHQLEEKDKQIESLDSKYCEKLNKNNEMKECLFSISGIFKVIVERWK